MAGLSRRLVLLVVVPVVLASLVAAGAGTLVHDLSSSPVPAREAPVEQQILYSTLDGVTCPAPDECLAVGDYLPSDGDAGVGDPDDDGLVPHALAEIGNGVSWRLLPTPGTGDRGSVLSDVSCVTSRDCVAVGYYQSSDDAADGSSVSLQTPLVEIYDGRSWSLVATPSAPPDSILTSVSCPSRTTCVAVGFTTAGLSAGKPVESPFIESTLGGVWRRTQLPSAGSLSTSLLSVSCATPTTCIAVGESAPRNDVSATRPSTSIFEAGKWRSLELPRAAQGPGALYGVDCTGLRSCIAVGSSSAFRSSGSALVEFWNGAEWTTNSSVLRQPGDVVLTTVTCSSDSACIAAGSLSPSLGAPPQELLVRLGETSWQVLDLAARSDTLDAVTCIGQTRCLVVGSVARNAFGNTESFIASWSGHSLAIEPSLTP